MRENDAQYVQPLVNAASVHEIAHACKLIKISKIMLGHSIFHK